MCSHYKQNNLIKFAEEIISMATKNQHVLPLGRGWAVKAAGVRSVTAITSKKTDAIAIGKAIAQRECSMLVVHGRDGKVKTKTSFAGKENRSLNYPVAEPVSRYLEYLESNMRFA